MLSIDLRKIAQEVGEKKVMQAVKASVLEIKTELLYSVFEPISQDYYDEYSPKTYKRTNDLLNIWRVDVSAQGLKLSFNGIASSDNLSQHVSGSKLHKKGSGSWISFPESWERGGNDNGMPQNDWIFDNFIAGVHPRFTYIKSLKSVVDFSVPGEGAESSYQRHIGEYATNNSLLQIIKSHL